MATLDVYAVIFHQSFLGQALFNTFFYEQISLDDDANEAQYLAQAFKNIFVTDAGSTLFENAAFSNDLQVQTISVSNLFNPLQLGIELIGGLPQGGNTASNEAPFVSYRITAPRKRSDMRNGQKYFGGMCNGSAVDGVIGATIMGFLGELADAMSQNIVFEGDGFTLEWRPVIVQRVRSGAGTPTDPYTYRLPDNLDEYEGFVADNWVASEILTTSNRRKIGRGL